MLTGKLAFGTAGKHNMREHLLSDNPTLSAAGGADKLHRSAIRVPPSAGAGIEKAQGKPCAFGKEI